MREQLLAALTQYGSPVLFGAVTLASIGVPLPITLLLIVTGSLVTQGAIGFWRAIALASAGSIIGDQIGYAIGRWGGRAVVDAICRAFGTRSRLDKAEHAARRWGGIGIFFTRWLFGILGPWVNLASGTTRYPWPSFVFWDVLGETVGVFVYVYLGRTFSDHILELESVLGDAMWAILALIVAMFLGWKLLRISRN